MSATGGVRFALSDGWVVSPGVPHVQSWPVGFAVLGLVGIGLGLMNWRFRKLEFALGSGLPDLAGRHAGEALDRVVTRLAASPDKDELRRRYRRLEGLDLVFAIVSAPALASVMAYFATRAVREQGVDWPVGWLACVPLALGLVDLIEDLVLLRALGNLDQRDASTRLVSLVMALETWLIAATSGIIVVTIAWWIASV